MVMRAGQGPVDVRTNRKSHLVLIRVVVQTHAVLLQREEVIFLHLDGETDGSKGGCVGGEEESSADPHQGVNRSSTSTITCVCYLSSAWPPSVRPSEAQSLRRPPETQNSAGKHNPESWWSHVTCVRISVHDEPEMSPEDLYEYKALGWGHVTDSCQSRGGVTLSSRCGPSPVRFSGASTSSSHRRTWSSLISSCGWTL